MVTSVRKANPDVTQNRIMDIISEMWGMLSWAERKKYADQSEPAAANDDKKEVSKEHSILFNLHMGIYCNYCRTWG